MATWDDVGRLALALPEVSEGTRFGNLAWQVRGKVFVWERPLSKADLRRLGGAGPEGPILAAYVDDLAEKEAVLDANPGVFFTIEHFHDFPAVLILLELIEEAGLAAAITDAWLARAPQAMVDRYLTER